MERAQDRSDRRVEIAHAAFESALRHATTEGLRDLHEALQTGKVAVQGYGKARLADRGWGTLGSVQPTEHHSACPLNALYIRSARLASRRIAVCSLGGPYQ